MSDFVKTTFFYNYRQCFYNEWNDVKKGSNAWYALCDICIEHDDYLEVNVNNYLAAQKINVEICIYVHDDVHDVEFIEDFINNVKDHHDWH